MITDEQKDLLLEQYYDHGILKKEIRSYEVSLWTLQDEFITVLKWSDVEQKGRIESPKMVLNIDGTEKFTFNIPMYYRIYNDLGLDNNTKNQVGELVENPNWYLVESDEYLIQGLRKIKVIFNKMTEDEHVFEFVIINVSETHENNIRTCEIECEGLAFQELGKIGYKINLSQENFELQYEDWYKNGTWKKTYRATNDTVERTQPVQTLNYWCEEAGLAPLPTDLSTINSRTWYYDVRMNWSAFIDNESRDEKKVYEEPYPTSWTNTLTPQSYEDKREKARAVEIEKSNLYNITQTIAEKFQVFCRYEYLYDENYHIIGRIVVFYNNFIYDDPSSIISFTYPYTSSRVMRKMECIDVTTKMHVLEVDDDTTLEGYHTVVNAPANASREDYILNFNYMYASGAINKEQYDAIKPYEQSMRAYNDRLSLLQQKKITYESQKIEEEAKKTFNENSLKLDEEQIAANQALQNALDRIDGVLDGTIQLTAGNPDQSHIQTAVDGKKFISLKNTNKGIVPDSIKLFNTFYISSAGATLADEVKSFEISTDANNNVESIQLLDEKELTVKTGTSYNWSKIFQDCYQPADYKGNVKLIDRPIVPQSVFIDAGYSDFDGTYGTLYSSSFTPLGDNDTAKSDDGKFYDIIYTCIKADGAVKTPSEMDEYLDSIIEKGTNPAGWMAADAQAEKLLLGYIEIADANTHSNTDAWAINLHNLQEEWDRIRATNNWFGNNSNPSNVSISTVTNYSDLTYFPKENPTGNQKNLNDYKNTIETTSHKLYITYRYNPHLYYDNVIHTWKVKWAEDNENLEKAKSALGPKEDEDGYASSTGLYKKIDDAAKAIADETFNKRKEMDAFQHLMGPALREGYWQPEDYNDYGDRLEINSNLTKTNITNDAKNGAIVGWDEKLFDEEQGLEYQVGVSSTIGKEYYPCIDLESVFGGISNIPTDLDEYSIVWKATNNAVFKDDPTTIKDLKVLAINSSALIRFININSSYLNYMYKPVLVITAAKTLSNDQISRMLKTARLEKYSAKIVTSVDQDEIVTTSVTVTHGNKNEIHTLNANNWLCYKQAGKTKPADLDQTAWDMFVNVGDRKLIYPRIKFSSLSLKTDSTNLKIKYNDHELMDAADYRVNTRDTLRDSLYFMEYYITIKPETLVKYGLGHSFNINYVLSNANTAIFLDALKISQENAYPKVSYEVAVNLLNDNSIIPTLYNRRAQIVMINDTDLKFKNVFGYISQVELNLDDASQDTIEVKNYKTKFEDIFSTIVAQTEQMKRMGEGFIAAASGEIPLSESTFATTMNQNTSILQAYLDSHFDSSQVVRDRLTSLFNEAGEILANSNKSLNKMKALTLENASILAGFAQNVSAELSGQVYKSPTRPASFKPNDVWIQTDEQGNIIGKYLATSFSTESSANGTAGFVRTYDGTLASITGAAVNFNADTGIVDITAQNEINIKSGNSIYIAANENVEIVGNKKVNIGGTEINLCTLAEKRLDPITGQWKYIYNGNKISEKTTTGINLIAGAYRDDGDYPAEVSRILIKPDQMSLGASELEFKAASQMNFITSQGETNNTSAVHISSDDGIWIGTGTAQGVRIFGGEITLNDDGTVNTDSINAAGASIELNSEHLILGYANTQSNNATAIEMNEKFVIIAAGDQITGNTTTDDGKSITGTTGGLVGTKFTKDSIGMAVITDGVITAMLMDKNGFTVGSGNVNITLPTGTGASGETNTLRASNGSYTRINKDGIELGSLADLYVNTNNFKLQTYSREKGVSGATHNDGRTILAVGNNLQFIDENSAYNPSSGHERIENKNSSSYTTYKLNGSDFIPQVDLLLNKNGLYVRGDIYADNGIFNGTLVASNFKIRENGQDKLWANYFADMPLSYMDAVYDTIEGLFDEAGTILSAASKSLTDVEMLNAANHSILTSFYQDIKADLTPNTYNGSRTASNGAYFKEGDIWKKDNNTTYIANCNWDELYWRYKTGNSGDKVGNTAGSQATSNAALTSTAGWNRIKDGRIADIQGASISVDSEAGTISIKAASTISILAKATIDLSSDDIDITGSNNVNISGGNAVNIASGGKIKLITSTSDSTAAVEISNNGITLKSAAEIAIKSSKGISIYSSDSASAAVIQINKDDGISLGSNKKINLSSTSSIEDGSNFLMTPERILIGVTGINTNIGSSSSAIDITKDYVIIASGAKFSSLEATNITSSATLSGIQIQKDYIGLATGNGTSTSSPRSLISISPTKILIGSAKKGTIDGAVNVNESNLTTANIEARKVIGGYIKIDNSGTYPIFEIGSTGIFKVLTPSMMLNNAASGENNMLELKQGSTSVLSFSQTNGLSIKGAITATKFVLTGDAKDQFDDAVNDAVDTSGWSTNGLGTETWQNKKYTALTSTSGLLLGMDYGSRFVIPVSANSPDTYVDISQDMIKFDSHALTLDPSTYTFNGTWEHQEDGTWKYKVNDSYKTGWIYYNNNWYYCNSSGIMLSNTTLTQNNKEYYFDSSGKYLPTHIYLSNSGIDMAGARLKMNGMDAWGRDDIVVMKTSDSAGYETQAEIETRMGVGTASAVHDWVLIKPYYNAEVNYFNNTMCWAKGNTVTLPLDTLDADPQLGNGASNYTVTFKCDVTLSQAGPTNGRYSHYEIKLQYKQKSASDWQTITLSSSNNGAIQDGGDTIGFGNINGYEYVEDSIQIRHRISFTYPLGRTNICYSDYVYQVSIHEIVGSQQTQLSAIQLIFKCDKTKSRVPCTIYYYP